MASRLAWANVFNDAVRYSETWVYNRRTPEVGIVAGYDPSDEIDRLERDLRYTRLRRIEESEGLQPRFDPGSYKDHGKVAKFSSIVRGHEAEAVFRLADTSCLPLRVGNVSILAGLARDALESEPLPTLQWHLQLLRSLSSQTDAAMDRHFGSVSVAKLDAGVAVELTARLSRSAEFWLARARPGSRSDRLFSIDRLGVTAEVLSRLIVRAEPMVALQAFRLGCNIATDPLTFHHWLWAPVSNLLRRSLLSTPPEQRASLALECLDFPLPTNTNPIPIQWPNPAAELFARNTSPSRPTGHAGWRACVAKLLAAVGQAGQIRSHALLRLSYLAVYGCLEQNEYDQFGALLWRSRDGSAEGLPEDIDLFPHVIAALPGNQNIDPVSVVRAYLFQDLIISADASRQLFAVAGAARHGPSLIPAIFPSRSQAVELLDRVITLVPMLQSDVDPFRAQVQDVLIEAAGQAIGAAILPCLETDDMTERRLEFITSLAVSGRGGGVLAGSHELARLLPDRTMQTSLDLRRAVTRENIGDVEGASRAVAIWAELEGNGRFPLLPDSLKEAIVASVEVGVRAGLLPRIWCVHQLFKYGKLSSFQIESLVAVLEVFREDLAYMRLPQEGSEAVGITSARAECVRLARSLIAAGQPADSWISDTVGDPLPEVRFAHAES